MTEEKSTVEQHDNATQYDSNWKKVRQEVTCAICLQLLDDPKSMPCLHTYCKKCLMEALVKRPHDPDIPRDRPAINCPLCRAEVTLPDKGIEGLPSNFSATRLVETVQLQDKFEQNKTQKCDSCIEGDAIASCCECGGFFLCKSCLSVHKKLPSTKAHSMLSLNQLVQLDSPFAASKSLLCQRHPQEPLKLYCEDCEALVCRDCVLVRHKLHNYNFVADIIDEEKECLQNVILEELTEILGSTKEAITGVEQMQAKVLSCNDQHVAQLNKTFQEIADMLNNRKRTFLVEVRQVTEDDLCPLQKQQEDLVTLKEKIKSCHDFTQKTLRDGTSTEIISAKKQMLERTKHLQELHSNSPMAPVTKPSTTVFYQMDKIKEIINSLGVVIDLQQSGIKDIPEKIYVDIGDSISTAVVLKDTKGQPVCGASNAITAEVTLDDNPVTSTVLESGDGKYSVTFTPTRYRNHTVSVKVNGYHISDSPTELKIDEQPSCAIATVYGCQTVDVCKEVDLSDTIAVNVQDSRAEDTLSNSPIVVQINQEHNYAETHDQQADAEVLCEVVEPYSSTGAWISKDKPQLVQSYSRQRVTSEITDYPLTITNETCAVTKTAQTSKWNTKIGTAHSSSSTTRTNENTFWSKSHSVKTQPSSNKFKYRNW